MAFMPRRWRMPFSWLGLFMIAFVVYELTHSPALGAVFVCLKFGWEDLRTARWIWRNDPDRWRRRSTFWLYTSWGLWKTALVAFAMSIAFAMIAPRNMPQGGGPVVAFIGTFLTTLACFALSTLTTFLAIVCAWIGGVRLWLDSAVHRARRLDLWPPGPLCLGRENRLGQLLLTGMMLVFLVGVMVTLMLVQVIPGGGFVAILLSAISPVLILLAREFLARRIWADNPYECWKRPEWLDDWRDMMPGDTMDQVPALDETGGMKQV